MSIQTINYQDSLKKRYIFKLSTNFIGLLISLSTSVLVPRGLGPKAFGDFNFLTNFFSQLLGFFDMGTSTAYYTKLSQRPRDIDMVRFYLFFVIFISLLTILAVSLSHWFAMEALIWPEQKISLIYLAAGLGIITWSNGILNQMADAYGLTVSTEKARIGQKVLGLVLIAILFYGHLLQLTNYFIYNYLIVLLLSGAFIVIMAKNDCFSISQNWLLSKHGIGDYLKEFYKYCHPLFVLSFVALVANIFDRWLLQFFGGSIQQGFYGLSFQIGALSFLFTSAITPLLMREFSIAYQHHDLNQMANLFRRYVPLLYSIAAFIACIISIQADKVIFIMGGKDYSNALTPVAIMSFYPLHQTYGQLVGSVFYATGDTIIYRNLGIVFLIIGIPLTYFLIAPSDKMGLDSGATGLALKTVLVNVMSVNALLYFASKILHLNFWHYLCHQVLSLMFLITMAVIATFTADYFFSSISSIILRFLLSGIIYTLITYVVVMIYPNIFGLKREDIKLVHSKIKSIYLSVSGRNV